MELILGFIASALYVAQTYYARDADSVEFLLTAVRVDA